MLVTYNWWQFKNVGDKIKILVTSFGCWCQTQMLRDRGYWWPKWPKPSSTSQNCHQHISSPKSVTNIDVARTIAFEYIWKWTIRGVSKRSWVQCRRSFEPKQTIVADASQKDRWLGQWSSAFSWNVIQNRIVCFHSQDFPFWLKRSPTFTFNNLDSRSSTFFWIVRFRREP